MNNTIQKKIILKKGREKSVLRFHPWIYSGAIESIEGYPQMGDTVIVLDAQRKFLAYAAFSPISQIQARIWSWDEQEVINEQFFEKRIEAAINQRIKQVSKWNTNAYRIIYAESDGLPGVIADRYDDVIVLQCLTAGAEYWREVIAEKLMSLEGIKCIYERSDAEVRSLEGLPKRCGSLRGEPSKNVQIFEGVLKYWVNIFEGQKTGFYLDQRLNRLLVSELSEGKKVLDCFCYTGGFSLAALLGGAKKVCAVDSSVDSLKMAEENVLLNGFDDSRIEFKEENVFYYLRELRDKGEQFDLIIVDPPKFAPTSAQVQKASRGYKDINLLALKLLVPNGLLITFSCSGGVDSLLFQKIIAGAAVDAKVEAQILTRLWQAPDHPIRLSFPEGEYLKGLVLQVLEN